MNDRELENLKTIIDKYTDVCVSISVFTDIMKLQDENLLEPVTETDILKRGLYGYLGDKQTKCWVSKSVAPGSIKIGLREPKDNRTEGDWSMQFKLAEFDINVFERMLQLKAFW